jgi:hypothetical protein
MRFLVGRVEMSKGTCSKNVVLNLAVARWGDEPWSVVVDVVDHYLEDL